MIEIIAGDLLLAQEKYIAHACNCVSQNAAGLAKSIFNKFPYANIYAGRNETDTMGTIKISGNGQDQRYIINMFSQFYPGHSKYQLSFKDSLVVRQNAFISCLDAILQIKQLESIAFPFGLSCGLAGGDWEGFYFPALVNFAEYAKEKQNARVSIYKKT